MGGKALDSGPSIRLNSNEYFELFSVLKSKLDTITDYKFQLVKSYTNKTSHGDMDLVFCRKGDEHKQVKVESQEKYSFNLISDTIGAVESAKNGAVCSMGVKTDQGIFQVDFIYVQNDEFDYACNYFNYNDLNNLRGRIAHKMHMKHGWDGLKYILRENHDDTRVIAELTITKDFDKALKFIGYDSSFVPNDIEDIFKHAVSSPYANKAMFLLENRNHEARTRDRKREVYNKFLTWLDTSGYKFKEFDWTEKEKLRLNFLEEAFERFPQFRIDYYDALKHHEKVKLSKLKFNGEIVSSLTGLSGKELGEFMKFFKVFHKTILNSNEEEFADSINNSTKELIEKQIINVFNRKEYNNVVVLMEK